MSNLLTFKDISRTLNLEELGIDLNVTFERLLSPEGIVNQFALTFSIATFLSIGWIVSGFIFAYLKTIYTTGPIASLLQDWEILFSPQAITNTLARFGLRVVWELTARVVTSFMLFGVIETVSQIVGNVTPLSVWQFASSENLRNIMVGRFFFQTIFMKILFPWLNILEPSITPLLD